MLTTIVMSMKALFTQYPHHVTSHHLGPDISPEGHIHTKQGNTIHVCHDVQTDGSLPASRNTAEASYSGSSRPRSIGKMV